MPDPRCARHRGPAMGEVAERLNAPVLKTGMAFGSSWVRIPPSPFEKARSCRRGNAMTELKNKLVELVAACWKDEDPKTRFMADPGSVLNEHGMEDV